MGDLFPAFYFKFRRSDRDNPSPRLTVKARLIQKNENVVPEEKVDERGYYYYEKLYNYSLVFEVESGDQMTFDVEKSAFEAVDEGDTGALSFQGSRFFGFEKEQG
ncbi:MAG: DUF2500 domain-containing protein [Bacillota bacterium]|nr:DUF2500 domain-containing protein [Bacillota bacterium]